MLCLSGFELYSHWVPLINRLELSYFKVHIYINFHQRKINDHRPRQKLNKTD